jgi:hypothetical protein
MMVQLTMMAMAAATTVVLDINRWLGVFSFTVKLVSEIMRAF